nr:hypothetical protein [uncultured Brevundimonas sp.]
MATFKDAFAQVFRDFEIAGVPASGSYEPQKALIRALGEQLDLKIAAAAGDDPEIIEEYLSNLVDEIWLPATALFQVQGSGSLTSVASRLPAWTLPPGAGVLLAAALRLPADWSKLLVDFVFVNLAANAGNVVFSAELHHWAEGDSINVTPSGQAAAIAASTTPYRVVRGSLTGGLAVDPTKTTTLRISRQGASANDTLPNACALMGVILRKTT